MWLFWLVYWFTVLALFPGIVILLIVRNLAIGIQKPDKKLMDYRAQLEISAWRVVALAVFSVLFIPGWGYESLFYFFWSLIPSNTEGYHWLTNPLVWVNLFARLAILVLGLEYLLTGIKSVQFPDRLAMKVGGKPWRILYPGFNLTFGRIYFVKWLQPYRTIRVSAAIERAVVVLRSAGMKDEDITKVLTTDKLKSTHILDPDGKLLPGSDANSAGARLAFTMDWNFSITDIWTFVGLSADFTDNYIGAGKNLVETLLRELTAILDYERMLVVEGPVLLHAKSDELVRDFNNPASVYNQDPENENKARPPAKCWSSYRQSHVDILIRIIDIFASMGNLDGSGSDVQELDERFKKPDVMRLLLELPADRALTEPVSENADWADWSARLLKIQRAGLSELIRTHHAFEGTLIRRVLETLGCIMFRLGIENVIENEDIVSARTKLEQLRIQKLSRLVEGQQEMNRFIGLILAEEGITPTQWNDPNEPVEPGKPILTTELRERIKARAAERWLQVLGGDSLGEKTVVVQGSGGALELMGTFLAANNASRTVTPAPAPTAEATTEAPAPANPPRPNQPNKSRGRGRGRT